MSEPATGDTWNARYHEQEQLWSGEPNPSLVRETASLTPGTALDLGCGEGADAIWLARQGWQVLGVDVSSVALDRAREAAVREGLADPPAGTAPGSTAAATPGRGGVRWAQVDLAHGFPEGSFDLVSAHYVHTHEDLNAVELEHRAASAVAVGGNLLFVVHTAPPDWESGHEATEEHVHHHGHGSSDTPRNLRFPTADELLAIVDEQRGRWEIRTAETFERQQSAPGGAPSTRIDLAIRLHRTA